ncbi:hypothetical protein MSAR_10210 [Mycolicibacterium sarraceniae]|uniref:6-phosphogluconate dehydrogenase NADP-binding domain-containing protein n=2 Tax=Mycolicibacterium sarraceniae TaxID=1534348 RepID=A0A7I7SPC4_9MYCO|nr:hypothetical protein MSAR_10210 [Mycolicibacterium sarraceniae]
MGAGIAANLIKAGHEVTVDDRSRPKVDALAAQRARPVASVGLSKCSPKAASSRDWSAISSLAACYAGASDHSA